MSFDLQIKNGDLVIKNGDLAKITGQDKLVQDILKIALTDAGSNPLQPWYGSYLTKSLIGSALEDSVTIDIATTQLRNSIENLKKLQSLQVNTRQSVSPDEQIAFISDISVVRNNIDYRLFNVSIKVLNRAFNNVSANFAVTNG